MTANAREVTEEIEFSADGSIEYENFSHFNATKRNFQIVRNQGTFKLELRAKLGSLVSFLIIPEAKIDDDDLTHGVVDEIADDDLKRDQFNFEEATITFSKELFDITLGKQIFSWGKANLFSPMDILNPYDLGDMFDSDNGKAEKIGIPALSIGLYPQLFSLNVVVVPLFTPTRLPGHNARFSLIPEDFPIPVNTPSLPSATTGNIQYASRLSTSVQGWDLSFVYFRGFNDVPRLTLTTGTTGFLAIPVFDRISAYGMGFATSMNDTNIQGEVLYLETEGNVDDDYIQYLAGIDYTFSEIIGYNDLTIIIEYARETIISGAVKELSGIVPPTLSDGQKRVLTNSILNKMIYEFSDTMKVEFVGVYNFDDEDVFIRPKMFYDIKTDITLSFGFDFFLGGKSTFFGQFDHNDRFFMQAKYQF